MLSGEQNRMTRQRKVILEELRKVKSHPTADEVYEMVRKKVPRISLGTVYRNLETLSEIGLIQKIDAGSAQKRFDGDIGKHYHIRCITCERVFDMPAELVEEPKFRKDGVDGCRIINYSLHFTGVCKKCTGK